jgi:AAA domain, putative AbiEii toxin, Type IV TA system/AAA ATPase domain
MKLLKFRIQNFKGFYDSGEVELGGGFNFFVGQNDSGKSSLMEALSLQISNAPHRSTRTLPTPVTLPDPTSVVTYTASFGKEDLDRAYGPSVAHFFDFATNQDSEQAIASFKAWCALARVEGRCTPGSRSAQLVPPDAGWPEATAQTQSRGVQYQRATPGDAWQITPSPGNFFGGNLVQMLADQALSTVYVFRAERLNVGQAEARGNLTLATNAANLAEVLNQLSSSSPAQWEPFLQHVRDVFPHIARITSPLMPSSHTAEIKVWTDSSRQDLAVPLTQSGTGIGQVLALLYQVVQSELPSVICIDEPQSFLHPGAFRKLLEILRRYQQHQYLISTHSPAGLNMAEGDRLFVVKRTAEGSKVTALPGADQNAMRSVLAEVGARLSDVFGADRILWVEGKTEEYCIPELLRRFEPRSLMGLQVLGVISTDELKGRDATRICEIYARLSHCGALMPPPVAFVLDNEGMDQTKRDDITRRMGRAAKWLPRRMYECYLLDCAVIAHHLQALDPEGGATEESVRAWIELHGREKAYSDGTHAPLSAVWIERVDAAKLLHALWVELTQSRFKYDKVQDGLALTRACLEKSDPGLEALASEFATWVATPPATV